MTIFYSKKQSKVDLTELKEDSFKQIELVKQALSRSLVKHQDIQRSMTIMMVYALWERFFRQSNGICLRLVRSRYKHIHKCPANFASMWFRKSAEFKSLISLIYKFKEPKADKETKGPYQISENILKTSKNWSKLHIDTTIDVEDLVVTFSNINKKVVVFNAEIFEINDTAEFKSIDFSKIDELVSRRNDAAHAGFSDSLGKIQTDQLVSYVEVLIDGYYNLLFNWIKKFQMR